MGAHYKIRTEKTGHYYTHGRLESTTENIWICLHGYGQLSRYFIQRFEFLDPAKNYVIAPEGMNRFYDDGLNGRPVSNWMTREDRLDEIADFILFLEGLRQKLHWEKNTNVRIIYLGFSQGVTTLIRWLHDRTPRVDYLLLWAGGLPDDLIYDLRREYFSSLRSFFFIGDKDPFFTPETIDEKKPLVETMGLQLQVEYFQGSHTVEEKALRSWVKNHLGH